MTDRSPPSSAFPGTSPLASNHGKRRWLTWLLVLAAVLAIGYAVVVRPLTRSTVPSGRSRGGASFGAMPVTAEPARRSDLDVRIVALGTVTPVRTVTVHSRVDGELQKLFFDEGTTVKADTPLADIDPRPFEVQKLQAEAQLAKDTSLLDNARLDLARYQTLLDQDSVAKQQFDAQAALVRQYEAALKVDQAQIETAKLQLIYAHIVSPVSGRIGLRLVDQGNIVHAADPTGIAVITQLHPITVLFSIPQDAVPKVMNTFATGKPMVVDAFARDGTTRLATGRLVTIDNQVDPTTGTVKLRAEFPNTDETLFPNQFVNVQLVDEQLKGVTVVQTAAVQSGTAGTYVYVVNDGKTVSVRSVVTGPAERDRVQITKGLAPGEMVVVDGVDKLREGSAVELVSRGAAGGAPPTKPKAWKGYGKGPAEHP